MFIWVGLVCLMFPHLVEIWPVGADSQFNLHPGTRGWAGHIPNGHSHGTVVFLDVHVEVARVAVVSASNVVVEGDAVSVILPQLRRQQQSLLSRKTSRRVHHHEGPPWKWSRHSLCCSISNQLLKQVGLQNINANNGSSGKQWMMLSHLTPPRCRWYVLYCRHSRPNKIRWFLLGNGQYRK